MASRQTENICLQTLTGICLINPYLSSIKTFDGGVRTSDQIIQLGGGPLNYHASAEQRYIRFPITLFRASSIFPMSHVVKMLLLGNPMILYFSWSMKGI